MYNVLIVDDEQEIRTGLRLKMDWASLGFEVAGEANHGQEALDLLETGSFHVLITDIKMPIMGGLELLKRVAAQYPLLKVIVLSGHDDFHYVKAAVQCGAKDYLLKPVVGSELKELIKKLRAELEADSRQQSQHSEAQWKLQQALPVVREQLMLALISDEGEDYLLPLRSDIASLKFTQLAKEGALLRFLCVEMRLPAGRLDDSGKTGLFRLAFQMLCRELIQQDQFEEIVFAFHHPSYIHMMHYFIAADTQEQLERVTGLLIRQVHEQLRIQLRIESVVAVGEPVVGLPHIRRAFLSALLTWSKSQSGAVTQTILADGEGNASEPLQPELEKRLLILLEDADLERFADTLEGAIQTSGGSLQDIHTFMLRVVILLEQAVRKNGITAEQTQDWLFPVTQWQFTTREAAIAYLKGLASFVMDGIRRSRVSGGTAVAEAVRQHIDQYYMNEISLSLLADRFHINTTYLSELFKRQAGVTFSEYLVQVRIRKAAELLADPNLRLADIAELVGIANASYLSSSFKKLYGVSPNEYRIQRLKETNRLY
ncbi:response regulator [Paenibacillus sp. GCM10012307]|uniref:Response regulator n=1 Tax=Paenibacillus roseus TaxID=2798579 RepID=A0A934J6G2_9BACL|nr:response regulator [Paenibacillus roseus]MBJ6362478.1 response regulator [Paenibacillus roseus]